MAVQKHWYIPSVNTATCSAVVPWGNLKYPNVKSTDLAELSSDVDQEVTWDSGTLCETPPQLSSLVFNDKNSHWTTSNEKENLIIFLQKSTPCQQNHPIAILKHRCQKYHPREWGDLPCHSYHSFPHQAVSGSTNPFEIPVSLSFTLLPAQCHWCWHWQAPVTSDEFWICSTGLVWGRRGSLGFWSVSSSFPLI